MMQCSEFFNEGNTIVILYLSQISKILLGEIYGVTIENNVLKVLTVVLASTDS